MIQTEQMLYKEMYVIICEMWPPETIGDVSHQ